MLKTILYIRFQQHKGVFTDFSFFIRERGAEYRPAEYALDGLNSLRYRVVERGEQALYTHLLIDLGYPKIFACSNMPANPFDTQKGEIFKSTVEDYRKQIERDRARY